MMTIAVILAIWVLLSLPLSVILGHSMKCETETEPELLGMDGDVALLRGSDGLIHRVALGERTTA